MGRFDPDKEEYYAAPKAAPADAPASGRRFAPETHFPATVDTTPPPGTPETWGDALYRYSETADDLLRSAVHSGTFGMDIRGNALAGWAKGDYPSYSAGVEAERAKLEKQKERSPIASTIGDVVGGVAVPGLGGAGLAARGIQAGLRPLLARGLGYGAEGALVGAAQGAGTTYTGNAADYLKNAATGGGIGFATGGVVGSALGPRNLGPRSTAEVPSTQQLYAEKNRNYADLNRAPDRYEPAYLARQADIAENSLRTGQGPYLGNITGRFGERDSPNTFRALEEMRGAPTAFPVGQAPVSPADIDLIRRGMSNMNPITQGTDIVSAGVVRRALDDFMRNPPPGAVLPGSAGARPASEIAQQARGNVAAYHRGTFMDDLIDNAQNAAGSANSGLNLQNILRQGARSAVRRTKGESQASRAGFNDAEIGALTDYARVRPVDEALRYVDRVAGGGGGLGALAAGGVGLGAGAGYFQGDPVAGGALGLGVPLAGLALRRYGNQRALRQIEELGDTIRQRSPLYAERVAAAPMVTPGKHGSQMLRDAITVGLIQKGFGQERGEDDPLKITVTPRRGY